MFSVKRDATRPFRVLTGKAVVQVLGTEFNVYRRADESALVSVVEGRVRVASQALSAGEEANVLRDGKVLKRETPDVSQTLAWRQRRLIFRETAMAEVIQQFNRYNNEPQLEIRGDVMAQRRITGTFNADEPLALINFLQHDPGVELDVRPQVVTIGAKD